MENKNMLDIQVNHRIVTLAGLIKRQIFRIIAEQDLDITPEQWVIISYLWEENGLSLGELVARSRKDFANVTRIVEKLQGQGYVTKERNKNDGRSYLVYHTEKATQIKSAVEKCQQHSLEISLQNISAQEQQTLLQIIGKMEQNSLSYLNK